MEILIAGILNSLAIQHVFTFFMVASLKKHYRHIMYLGWAQRQIRKNFSIHMFIGEKGLWSPICIPPYIYKWFCHSNELDFFTGTWINLPLKVFINTSISFECFILKVSLHILLDNHWVFIRITIFHFIPFSFKHFSLFYNKVAITSSKVALWWFKGYRWLLILRKTGNSRYFSFHWFMVVQLFTSVFQKQSSGSI